MRQANPQRREHKVTVDDRSVILRWSMASYALLFDAFDTDEQAVVYRRIFGGHPTHVEAAARALVVEGKVGKLLKAIDTAEDFIALHDAVKMAAQGLPPDLLEDGDEPDGDEGSDEEGEREGEGKPEADKSSATSPSEPGPASPSPT